MDGQARHDLETMKRWAAEIDAHDRIQQRIRFWLNWRQVVDDPAAAVPDSGDPTHSPQAPPSRVPGWSGSELRGPADAARSTDTGSQLPDHPHT